MNWLDIVLSAILIVAFIQGVTMGFARVAISFAGTLLALFLAAWNYDAAAQPLMDVVKSPGLAKFMGFVLIFLLVQGAAALIAWGVQKIFKASGLSWLDRILGAGFGLLRGLFLSTILLLVLMAFPFGPMEETVARSQVAPYIIGVANIAVGMAPKELKDGFYATYEKVKQLWEKPGGQAPDKGSA